MSFDLNTDLLEVTLLPSLHPVPSAFPSANACSIQYPSHLTSEVPEFFLSSQPASPKLLETLGSRGKSVDTGFYH